MLSALSSEPIFPRRCEVVTTCHAAGQHPAPSFSGSKQSRFPWSIPLSLPGCHDRRRNAICRSNDAQFAASL